MKVYLAGPMTGYPLFNFPAFDAYRDFLTLNGYSVISPADIDRKHGFDPEVNPKEVPSKTDCAKRDVDAICGCRMMFVMPGWEKSKGCKMEMAVADFLGIQIVLLSSLPDMERNPCLNFRIKPEWESAGYFSLA